MSLPGTFRTGQEDKFLPVTINLEKLRVMLKERKAEADAASKKVEHLRRRLSDAKKKGVTFPADQVAENLGIMSHFYTLEGRVQQLEELVKDFENLSSSPPHASARPTQASTQGPPREDKDQGFRL